MLYMGLYIYKVIGGYLGIYGDILGCRILEFRGSGF